MRIKVMFFTIALLALSAFSWEHPLKMSFSNLNINSNGSVEIETRIFLDDLTAHLQKIYSLQHLDFSTVDSNGTQALRRYLLRNFYFEQDGQRLNLWITAISQSKNDLALVVNLSTTKALDISKDIILVNTLLCDAAPTQINDVKYLGKHIQLSSSNPEIKLIPASTF